MKNTTGKRLFLSIMLALVLLTSLSIGIVSTQEMTGVSAATGSKLIAELKDAGVDVTNMTDKLEKLTPAEKTALRDELLQNGVIGGKTYTKVIDQTGIKGGTSVTTGAKGGARVTVETWRKNYKGQKVWSYYSQVVWYYSSGKITSKQHIRWGQLYSATNWNWEHYDLREWGGEGQSSYEVWTQGHFRYCAMTPFGEWTITNDYPIIDITVRGTGTYTYTTN